MSEPHSSDIISIRLAIPGDAAAASEVLIRARLAAAGAIPPPVHAEDDIRDWVRDVLIPLCEVWIAEDEDSRVVALLVLDDDWIDQLYVRPEVTGTGIGGRLVDLAKSRQPEGLQLRTFASNPGAQRFYERHGFVVAERTNGSGNEEKEPDLRYVWAGTPGETVRNPSSLAAESSRLS